MKLERNSIYYIVAVVALNSRVSELYFIEMIMD